MFDFVRMCDSLDNGLKTAIHTWITIRAIIWYTISSIRTIWTGINPTEVPKLDIMNYILEWKQSRTLLSPIVCLAIVSKEAHSPHEACSGQLSRMTNVKRQE